MPAMIDLHVHILPGLDDGPAELAESLAMARMALADGVSSLVATPHFIKGAFNNTKDDILRATEHFRQQLDKEGIALEIYSGAEYMLDPELPAMLEDGRALTINNGGRYLLIEFPMLGIPGYARQILYELQLQGVTPIIAHPERNSSLIKEPRLLESFLDLGVLSQVTSGSLAGLFGPKVKELGWYYLRQGMCHLISSDAHSTGKRASSLGLVAEAVSLELGQEIRELLISQNPGWIIQGEDARSCPISNTSSGAGGRGFF
ncbi:MAG: phosphotransferase, partial [Peptococcaceae bacterium]|nr:phosphotransferase [Peptococcaceae bacterium]